MNEATSGLTSAAFAIEQPAEVDVNEIVIRPTAQVYNRLLKGRFCTERKEHVPVART
jgi:hypothetical protein